MAKNGKSKHASFVSLENLPRYPSYCNNPLSEHTFVVWKLMKRNFHTVFLIHYPGTEWSCRCPSMPHLHPALPRPLRATAILELGVFSVLYYVIKVTLHYFMLHRFEIHSALELSRTDCSCLVASRLCEAARWSAIIRFAIVIIILPVCNASQLTYQYATSIDNKFIINGCCIFRSYLAGLSMLYGSTPV